ncbi:hypothetical protein [Streptomyces paromomycinus]|uniref:hypothetical protein n=1 Tax=Streptomyces paromomycinus TaxID=92743 RepID=UPI0014791679|nr:hypothetical protein [Streptomyces paromomycinus]
MAATCGASPFMVEQAWAHGIPVARQRAESLLFRDAPVAACCSPTAATTNRPPSGAR